MFEIKNKSINGQYQFLCDRKIKNYVTSPKPKKLVPGPYSTKWSYNSLAYNKNMADEENYYMHIKEESIIYIWSKIQLDTCMFDSNIMLTKFGSGFWSWVPGIGPGFYSLPISDSELL